MITALSNPFMTSLYSGSLLAAAKLSVPDADLLREAYRSRFPAPTYQVHSSAIIDTILDTPSEVPAFHVTLLEAFASAHDAGSRHQFFSARAIRHVFHDNSQVRNWGRKEHVLLQGLIVLALTQTDDPIQSLQMVTEAMREGLSRAALARVVEDSPFLEEFRSQYEELTTPQYLMQLFRRGYSDERLARELNGTCYTAHINDMRLARKVVSVFADIYPHVYEDKTREAALDLLDDAIKNLVLFNIKLNVRELFILLQIRPNRQVQALQESWEAGKFDIEIISDEDFDALAAAWDGLPLEYSLFIPGERDRIVIRALPPLNLDSFEAHQEAFREVTTRLLCLVHEGEHWRHHSGHYEGVEAPSKRINLNNIDYHDRMVAELMAAFEAYRWRVRHLDNDPYEIAYRMGQTLALYLRGEHEITYSERL